MRSIPDGSLVASLTGKLRERGITFGEDSPGAYFVVDYENGASELWDVSRVPRRLASLGLNKKGLVGLRDQRALIWYTDGRAYLMDLAWLRTMEGNSAALTPEALMRACFEGPFRRGLFDDAALTPYLDSRPPQAGR